MCFAGAVVASWSLTQEVAGSNPFTVYKFFWLNSANSVKTFRKNSINCFPDFTQMARNGKFNRLQSNQKIGWIVYLDFKQKGVNLIISNVTPTNLNGQDDQ